MTHLGPNSPIVIHYFIVMELVFLLLCHLCT